jgi:hypothetical protein
MEVVLDRRAARSVLARVDQDVGSDLRESGLEQDEIAIVRRPSGALAKQVHRMVNGVQSFVESSESGVELKRRDIAARGLRSQ